MNKRIISVIFADGRGLIANYQLDDGSAGGVENLLNNTHLLILRDLIENEVSSRVAKGTVPKIQSYAYAKQAADSIILKHTAECMPNPELQEKSDITLLVEEYQSNFLGMGTSSEVKNG